MRKKDNDFIGCYKAKHKGNVKVAHDCTQQYTKEMLKGSMDVEKSTKHSMFCRSYEAECKESEKDSMILQSRMQRNCYGL